jgi:uncharacterized protein YegP (UPF0339 family)
MNTGRRLALTIGCSYKDRATVPKLNGTINDANNMTNLLKTYGYDVIVMNDNNISSSPLYPSKTNIQNAIISILQNSQSGDDVVIFYAGHGLQVLQQRQKNADSSIVTDYEEDGKDEALAPVDVVIGPAGINKDTVILDDSINLWLKQYGKKGVRIFLIFDCCHSGTMCDLKYTYSCSNSANDKPCNTITVNDLKSIIQQDKGDPSILDSAFNATIITLSACKDNEVSWEDFVAWDKSSGQKEGLLTSSFIYNIKTSDSASKDVLKLLYCIAKQTASRGQHPKISSSIPIHEQSNDNNRYILQARQYSNPQTITNLVQKPDNISNAIDANIVKPKIKPSPLIIPGSHKNIHVNDSKNNSKINTNADRHGHMFGFRMNSIAAVADANRRKNDGRISGMPYAPSANKIRFVSINQRDITKNIV